MLLETLGAAGVLLLGPLHIQEALVLFLNLSLVILLKIVMWGVRKGSFHGIITTDTGNLRNMKTMHRRRKRIHCSHCIGAVQEMQAPGSLR